MAHFGLEHHQSSDDRVDARNFLDDDLKLINGGLLPHEFTHSWNGKYRRPAGLATPNYQQPMKGELLWVYEGLTEYYGDVLTARSGIWTRGTVSRCAGGYCGGDGSPSGPNLARLARYSDGRADSVQHNE